MGPVTSKANSGTKGAVSDTKAVTSDAASFVGSFAFLATLWAVLTLVLNLVNAVTVLSDLRRNHIVVQAWEPYVWEMSSWVAMAPLIIAVFWVEWRAAANNWPAWKRLAAFVPATVIVSALHVAGMVLLREGAYLIARRDYDFGDIFAGYIYEYRKDLLSAAVGVLISFLYRRALRPTNPGSPASVQSADPAFLVPTKDGTLVVHAREIDWIEAQGNYVALYVDGTPRLIRKSLNDVEKRLAGGTFLRTHRSALVNRLRVKGVKRDELGVLKVELVNRQLAPLSEGRRSAVLMALAQT